MKRPLILLSGGLDSALLLWYAEAQGMEVAALHIFYGQPAGGMEINACRDLCTLAGVRLFTVRTEIPSMDAMNADPGLAGPRVVPARNAILCSLAVGLAVDLACDEVWIGCNAADVADYPDCRAAFIEAMSEAAALATDGAVKVSAPLLGHSKGQIIEEAEEIGVPIGVTWSCYSPVDHQACGTCDSCRIRLEAEERL